MKVGLGYDVHQLVEGRPLIIGGVHLPYDKGLLGHSDADVLTHAVMDAILGALGKGDIGKHFPDTDDRYKNISSIELLKEVQKSLESSDYKIGNIDAVIVAQKPKMAPFLEAMVSRLARVLKCDLSQINIKATTTERLGFEGREEGISAHAIVMIVKWEV
ncbi:2-C-methyl-D-erythritol 2,4-cyclodiphosphate synthase [Fusibacter tunisiensis]|uniref:2-C-methyl-D-erythritol 2,4-cyclodiphosphate synthase n=1 Tax=Fusibacter tunisiensis TaxID=1008308 RepID=A0ABS2MQS9_9FIRM|nr:2-C-methyl-D-erythritol 2,4-cyclodiphosphate synthase [Fusibacter tunisiensis]MBM7561771.1 2-C-methyl-D-erythritol 2,4-cyclodiphosphate synthase [Fusibacter tunisiensis]